MTQDEIYAKLKRVLYEAGYLSLDRAEASDWSNVEERAYESFAYHKLGRADFRSVPHSEEMLNEILIQVKGEAAVEDDATEEDEDVDAVEGDDDDEVIEDKGQEGAPSDTPSAPEGTSEVKAPESNTSAPDAPAAPDVTGDKSE